MGLRTRLAAAFGMMVLIAVGMAMLAMARLPEALASVRNMLAGLALLSVVLGGVFAAGLSRSITQPLAEAILIAETVAAGDLSQDFETKRTGEFGRLLSALGTMEDTLTDLVGDIQGATGGITGASQQIAAGNTELSQRTEEQAASLEQTAASVEQFSATVRQNAERASSASRQASGAVEVAQRGGAIVGEVVATMDKISGSSKRIGDIIGVIDGIAAQTNILAINASVEAARAGEQGRGFAVVANEVRSLAQRSAAAAREIKGLIDDSVAQVGSGTVLVGHAGQTMERIVQSVTEVHSVLGEISTASAEQSNGIAQVHQALSHMDGVTQQNARMVQQAADATHALADRARQLQQAVDAFKL